MNDQINELEPYRGILDAARVKRFREWQPKLRYLAEQFNTGALVLPHDPVLLYSLLGMKERTGEIDMSTVDTNCRMLAQAVWDAKEAGITNKELRIAGKG